MNFGSGSPASQELRINKHCRYGVVQINTKTCKFESYLSFVDCMALTVQTQCPGMDSFEDQQKKVELKNECFHVVMVLREAGRAVENSITVGELLRSTWQNLLLHISTLDFNEKIM